MTRFVLSTVCLRLKNRRYVSSPGFSVYEGRANVFLKDFSTHFYSCFIVSDSSRSELKSCVTICSFTRSLNLFCCSSFDWTSIVSLFSSSLLVSLTRVLAFLWFYFCSTARGSLAEFLASLFELIFSVFLKVAAFLPAGCLL